jgi:hypothetical protein
VAGTLPWGGLQASWGRIAGFLGADCRLRGGGLGLSGGWIRLGRLLGLRQRRRVSAVLARLGGSACGPGLRVCASIRVKKGDLGSPYIPFVRGNGSRTVAGAPLTWCNRRRTVSLRPLAVVLAGRPGFGAQARVLATCVTVESAIQSTSSQVSQSQPFS